MSFMYFEGTKDYTMATPALMTTFEASGSTTPGRFGVFMSATDQRIYTPASTYQGNGSPAGLILATVANGEPCPVLVWGYAKNVATSGTAVTYITSLLSVSGSGWVYNSGAGIYKAIGTVGKGISGSATLVTMFVNCMP